MEHSAGRLTTWQRCKRRYLFELTHRPIRWQAKSLFDACLRRAVLSLSSGVRKETVESNAVSSFMQVAADPGIDTLSDPWTIAQDYCSMLKTIIEAVSRLVLVQVASGPSLRINNEMTWKVQAFREESGVLHRWVSVDSFDQDVLYRELHGWHVFGDMVASGTPLVLHVVEIGQMRGGRRHSAWCRAFKHPIIAGRFKFQSKGGRSLKGEGWKPVWFSDSERNDSVTWVDCMEKDGVSLIHHVDVKEPAQEFHDEFWAQLRVESKRMEEASADSPFSVLMDRPACDFPYPCPWQSVCYQAKKKDLDEFAEFRRVSP